MGICSGKSSVQVANSQMPAIHEVSEDDYFMMEIDSREKIAKLKEKFPNFTVTDIKMVKKPDDEGSPHNHVVLDLKFEEDLVPPKIVKMFIEFFKTKFIISIGKINYINQRCNLIAAKLLKDLLPEPGQVFRGKLHSILDWVFENKTRHMIANSNSADKDFGAIFFNHLMSLFRPKPIK
ncbi:unnamed protein product [Blepharisma stoltei]|uniref:Uncharacterized protein n=1 Tax=Blepharisma stoltei TaxID=1481888 RepID=A0AAU9K4U1_9CILI|nr:unnamed protein product [Blepharisma stoltei]